MHRDSILQFRIKPNKSSKRIQQNNPVITRQPKNIMLERLQKKLDNLNARVLLPSNNK